jgi:hypothetical protein
MNGDRGQALATLSEFHLIARRPALDLERPSKRIFDLVGIDKRFKSDGAHLKYVILITIFFNIKRRFI